MTLQQLEYALALRKTGSFGKAAIVVGISQPAMSLQIQKLEEETGLTLFDRNNYPILPTDDGEAFLTQAESIVYAAERLRKFSSTIREDFTGNLKIGIIPTLAPFLVPLFADAFSKKYPDIQLEISEMLTNQIISGIKSGEIDAGIISTPAKISGLLTDILLYEKFYMYANHEEYPGSDIRLEDIDYAKLWLLEEGNCFRDQINDFCNLKAMRQHKTFIYKSHSIDALIRLVDARGGMTILPELTTLSLNAQQEENIHEIKGRPKAREIGLIRPQNAAKIRFIEKLIETIRQNVPIHMLDDSKYEVVDPNINYH